MGIGNVDLPQISQTQLQRGYRLNTTTLLSRIVSTLTVAMCGLLLSLASQAAPTPRLLVLYPQISAAYDQIFNEIIAGIESNPKSEHAVFAVQSSTTAQEISRYIRRNNISAVIALGKQTYDIAQTLQKDLPVIHGGMLITPGNHNGISLMGSPEQFFSRLTDIAPSAKRVFTVYNEENSGWLIRLAQQAAKSHGIELKAYAAADIREAVQKFKGILEQANGPGDSIWLLLDSILPDKTIMPMALESAWRNRLVLFSNNPSHTRRGALFALFPDHLQMGNSLANLALEKIEAAAPQPRVMPLSNLKLSLNRRTAAHLGINYSKTVEEELDVIYPQQ